MSSQLLELSTDLNDAGEIFKLLMVLKDFNETNKSVHNRALREAVQKIWQEKRFPKPTYTHNKPHAFPWSLTARDAYFAQQASGTLVLEHIIPMKQVIGTLLEQINQGIIHDAHTMLTALRDIHNGVRFIIIHKSDDALLKAAGLNSAGGSFETPFARYQEAGINVSSLVPLTEDRRYS